MGAAALSGRNTWRGSIERWLRHWRFALRLVDRLVRTEALRAQVTNSIRPLARLYTAPTTWTFLSSTALLRMGAAILSFSTLRMTFCLMALLSVSPGLSSTALTAGLMLVTTAARWPGSAAPPLSDLIAALTGPHDRCPRTMTS